MELLDRIDRAVDGLCPCGADPRPNSAYCSPDCEPTHRGEHTTSDIDGTAMRWRPALAAMGGIEAPAEHAIARMQTIDLSPVAEALRALAAAYQPAVEALKRAMSSLAQMSMQPPDHPMLAEVERRRNLTHGPQRSHRPPRRLGPR